jgi:ribokinase
MDIRFFVDKFPEPDGEAKTDKLSLGGGGSAANVAVSASRLGVKSGFIGTVGFDSYGRTLLGELEREGVDVACVKIDTTTNSGITCIAVNVQGQVMMFGYVGASDKLFPEDLKKEYVSSAKHLHITGLSFDTALAAAKIASKAKVVVSFDPGRLMSSLGLKNASPLLKEVDQILLNNEEAKALTGESNLEEAGSILLKSGPKVAVIKRGGDGVFVMTKDSKFSVPAPHVKVVDTTGAGDSFSGGFITAQLEGESLEDSIKFASATAGLKITRVGARALPTRTEVERFLKAHDHGSLI